MSKKNHEYMANFFSELHKLQGGVMESVNLVDNTPDADKYYHEFMEIQQDAVKIAEDIKNEVYDLIEDVDELVIENRIKNLLKTYNKLKNKEVEMDQSNKNMYITKLKEVEGSHDIFTHVAHLIKGEADIKGKELSERENKLDSIFNFVKLHETDLHNLYPQYTPEHMEKINKIFDNVNASISVGDLNVDHSNEYNDVRRHKNEAMLLMNATNAFSKEVEMLQNENEDRNGGKSHVVENYTNNMDELTEYAKTVVKKINDSKEDYAKIFDNTIENEAMLERIDLKKKDINETLANLNKTKEYLLEKLHDEEKLHHMREQSEDVTTSTDTIVKRFKTYNQMVDTSQNIDIRNMRSKKYESVDDIDKEISYINTYNKDLIESKLIVERVLENDTRKKNDMAQILSSISRDNSSIYEYAINFFDCVLKAIGTLTETIRNMEKLINENEAIMAELKDQRRKLQNVQHAPADLGKLDEVDKMAPRKLETKLLGRNESRNIKDGTTDSTLKDDKKTYNVNGEGTRQEHVMLKKGPPPQIDVYRTSILKNDKNDQESEQIDKRNSIKPVSTEKTVQYRSYLNNNNSNNDNDISTLYTLGEYNTPNNNYNTNALGDSKNEETNEKRNYALFVYIGGLFSALFIFIGFVFYSLPKNIGTVGVEKKNDKEKPIIGDTKIKVFEEVYGSTRDVKDVVIDVSFVHMEDNL
ncbi:hypothetical protein AK88_00932 [Plasmodium fragile]|uniref:Uncharacterized protein n=1 Tax=Plasmodium fragile TaxID=5857 RepID=A0A0D9QQZ3_PLAFR|nr:uncharacterized protein AK88_00932 [Plasmodium fragile]KJP89489.1 hypothetical protein AK88_00932 [Plasmodium fragile]